MTKLGKRLQTGRSKVFEEFLKSRAEFDGAPKTSWIFLRCMETGRRTRLPSP